MLSLQGLSYFHECPDPQAKIVVIGFDLFLKKDTTVAISAL